MRAGRQQFVLERLDVDGLGALVPGLGVVGHLGALGERTEALALDGLVMDEEVRTGLIGGDEAEALLVAEPLHGSCCHVAFPPRDVWCCETRRVLLRQRLRDAGTAEPGPVVPAVPTTVATSTG